MRTWSIIGALLAFAPAGAAAQYVIETAGALSTPTARTPRARFGQRVAISPNARWLAVGRDRAVEIYEVTAGTAVHRQTVLPILDPRVEASDGSFGIQGLALGDDVLFVGAPASGSPNGDDDDEDGVVIRYDLRDGRFEPVARLYASNYDDGGLFGFSIAVDGGVMLVGAPYYDRDGDEGMPFGRVFVFERSAAGDWSETAMLRCDGAGGAVVQYCGWSVAIRGDVLVGGALGGALTVWRRSARGAYAMLPPLTEARLRGGVPSDRVGWAVATDGVRVLGGAVLDDEVATDAGGVYVWTAHQGRWNFESALLPPDLAPNDNFGTAVALDGSFLAASRLADRTRSGEIRLFRHDGAQWTTLGAIAHPDGTAGGELVHVAMRGNLVAVGAPSTDREGDVDVGATWLLRVGLARGLACGGPSDCASGACVDGVCCESACEGACVACAASMTGGDDGTCAPIRSGTDPADECNDDALCATGVCDGAGACGVLSPEQCMPDAGAPDAGRPDAGTPDAGEAPPRDAGVGRDAGVTIDAAVSLDAGNTPLAAGCGCRASPSTGAVGWLAVPILVLALRRRRRV